MKLLKNLTNYQREGLENVEINGRYYRTNPDANPSIMFALAFGESDEGDSPNNSIAMAVEDAREYFKKDLPAMIQSDLGGSLIESGARDFYMVDNPYDHSNEGKSLALSKISSKEVMELGVYEAERNGFDLNSILYVAHPAHMERVIALGENMGLHGEPFTMEKPSWSQNDPQLWVRHPFLWIPREILTREYHNLKGYTN